MRAKLQTVRFCSEDIIATSDVVYCDFTASSERVFYNHFVPEAFYMNLNESRLYSGNLIQYTGPGQIESEVHSTAIIVDDEVFFGAYYHLVEGIAGRYTICKNQNHGLQ